MNGCPEIITCAMIVLAVGCGRTQTTAAPGPVAQAPDRSHPAACPLGVDTAAVAVSDADDGVDLTITATPDRVDELRVRVRDAAALHGAGAHHGLGHHGAHMGAQRHGLRLTSLPPVETTVDDIDGGARLHLRAIVVADVDALRERVREEVARVEAGPCD